MVGDRLSGMKIVVHDYAGHPFQVQLSRSLAKRGHEVVHVYSASLSTTPQGGLKKRADDPATFDSVGVDIGRLINKAKRAQLVLKDDPAHTKGVMQVVESFQPDVILSANAAPWINEKLLDYAWETECQFVCWVQDLFGPVAKKEAAGKFYGPFVGKLVDDWEKQMLRRSDAIVLIADDFKGYLPEVECAVHVIENWAPLEEMPVREKVNPWSTAYGLDQTVNFVYSGTLGMKHNPDLLVDIAKEFAGRPEVRVVVISAGVGMDYLKKQKEAQGLENLILMGFQPFEDLPDVMGAADVLVAVLEPEAGVFSVPSKVLSYLCAGRAVLMGVPPENLASKIVERNGAGLVVPPKDNAAFVEAARTLLGDAEARAEMGRSARAYAEATFDIEAITDRFERVFEDAYPGVLVR